MSQAPKIAICAHCGTCQRLALFCVGCGAADLAPVGNELPFDDPENGQIAPNSPPVDEIQGGNGGSLRREPFKGL
jgi:hypothetical protein